MKIFETALPDVLLFEPELHGDSRGFFMETFRASHFADRGIDLNFVQDNQSRSIKNTLRGLHFQRNYPQGKLVRVLAGTIFDVAVDIRENSPTFGSWAGEYLSFENRKQLWIPPGFAHGFYVLSEIADVAYKCTDYYHQHDECSVLWNDPRISVKWPTDGAIPLLSDRDNKAQRLDEIIVSR